jgi:glycosyltransferase involved in cell wall biosynthesis
MVEQKMEKIKLSVIMPVYNAGELLKESMESVLNQTFRDFEFVIINDCSTDNSLKTIKAFQKKDKRIRIINNKENLGVKKSLNKALELSKGEYVARMDADDISLPDRFKIQVNYLDRNPEIFLIGGSAIVINQEGKRWGVFEKYDNYRKIAKRLQKTNCIIHPLIMFRNTHEFFYREKFIRSEDYDLYLRILTSGKNLTNLPDFLLKYRISNGTGAYKNQKPYQEFFFQKAKEFYWQRRKKGKDDYENLSPPSVKPQDLDFSKMNLNVKIIAEFQDNQMQKARMDIREYFKRYGIDRTFAAFYILSFFPRGFIRMMKRNF